MPKSKIEWTERTWNPVTGCTKVSQGCKHCYAERMYERFNGKGSFKNITCHEDRLDIPLRVQKPSVFFVNSMSDLFHEDVPFEFIHKVFVVMALSPQHTFQVLTKRSSRMMEYFKKYPFDGFGEINEVEEAAMKFDHFMYDKKTHQMHERLSKAGWLWDVTVSEFGKESRLIYENDGPLPNVWIGVSVENDEQMLRRVPDLLEIPAAVKWLSMEPLLDRIEPAILYDFLKAGIDWVVVGGESGPGARQMCNAWPWAIRGVCEMADVPFFFKQWGEYDEKGKRVGKKAAGRLLFGKLFDNYPKALKR